MSLQPHDQPYHDGRGWRTPSGLVWDGYRWVPMRLYAPPKKSALLAFTLAFFFGPLGLIYANVWVGVIMTILAFILGLLTGLILAVVIWPMCWIMAPILAKA